MCELFIKYLPTGKPFPVGEVSHFKSHKGESTMSNLALEKTITATLVSDNERLKFLPKYFGRFMISGEAMIYSFLTHLCEGYTGGYWEFYELSNGGFYMAPRSLETLFMSNPMNHFSGEMSNQAAGITVCLFTLNALSFSADDKDRDYLIDHYYRLWDYGSSLEEGHLILNAID